MRLVTLLLVGCSACTVFADTSIEPLPFATVDGSDAADVGVDPEAGPRFPTLDVPHQDARLDLPVADTGGDPAAEVEPDSWQMVDADAEDSWQMVDADASSDTADVPDLPDVPEPCTCPEGTQTCSVGNGACEPGDLCCAYITCGAAFAHECS